MKKILLSLFIGTAISFSAHAQCVPDTTITALVVPPANSIIDTLNEEVVLPPAFVGMPYNEVMFFRVPADTNIAGNQIPIDYVKLDDILGLPAGFTLNCNAVGCKFPGGSFGCAELMGSPTMVDSIALRIAIEYRITIGGLPTPLKDTLGGYFLPVRPHIGLNELVASKNEVRVFPNPANDVINFDVPTQKNGSASISVSNLVGTEIYSNEFSVGKGTNPFSVAVQNFNVGIYLYQITLNNQTYSGRFSVNR